MTFFNCTVLNVWIGVCVCEELDENTVLSDTRTACKLSLMCTFDIDSTVLAELFSGDLL